MKKFISITFVALILAGSLTVWGQAPTSEKLASGTYIVYAISPQAWRFTVDPKTMANASIVGHFNVTDGNPKDIDVFVFSEENYWKFRGDDAAAKAAAKPVFEARKKADGDINVKLTEPGNYFLVFSNLKQYEGTKTFSADVKLQFEKK